MKHSDCTGIPGHPGILFYFIFVKEFSAVLVNGLFSVAVFCSVTASVAESNRFRDCADYGHST